MLINIFKFIRRLMAIESLIDEFRFNQLILPI